MEKRIDESWVDQQIENLVSTFGFFETEQAFLFEPTAQFYGLLTSGERADLQEAVKMLAQYPTICNLTVLLPLQVRYLSPGKGQPGTAGLIRLQKGDIAEIQIPFPFVGEPYLIGAILAHEISHFLLFSRGVVLAEPFENERFTDLGAVFFGFGKLLLNGKAGELGRGTGLLVELGYLSLDLTLYAYQLVNTRRNVRTSVTSSNLTPEAAEIIRAGTMRYVADPFTNRGRQKSD